MELSLTLEEVHGHTIDALGGKDNIITAAHCATRLRLVLKDESIVDTKNIDEISIVKESFSNSGQFQVIIGSGIVDEVYKELIGLTGISETSKSEVKEQATKKLNKYKLVL